MHDNSAQWMQDFETAESSSRQQVPLPTIKRKSLVVRQLSSCSLSVWTTRQARAALSLTTNQKSLELRWAQFATYRVRRAGRLGKGRGVAQIVCSKQRWLEPLGRQEWQVELLKNSTSKPCRREPKWLAVHMQTTQVLCGHYDTDEEATNGCLSSATTHKVQVAAAV